MTTSNLLMYKSYHINRQLIYQFISMTLLYAIYYVVTFTEQGQMKSKQLSRTNRGNGTPVLKYNTRTHRSDNLLKTLYLHSKNSIFLLAITV